MIISDIPVVSNYFRNCLIDSSLTVTMTGD